jgi:hypothetical protein
VCSAKFEDLWRNETPHAGKRLFELCPKTCGSLCPAFPVACTTDASLRPTILSINWKYFISEAEHVPLKGFVPTQLGNLGGRLQAANLSKIKFRKPSRPWWQPRLHDDGDGDGDGEGGGFRSTPVHLAARLTPDFLFDTDFFDSLSGTMPTEIGALGGANTHLHLDSVESLTLVKKSNRISGSLPTEIGRFCRSHALHLHGTGAPLSGSLPTQIGLWADHECHLHVGRARLSGTLPKELGTATQSYLTSCATCGMMLELSRNRISGTIGKGIGALKGLQYLWLDRNRISGTLPTELGMLASVIDLRVGSNLISGTIPSQLARLPRLRYTQLANSRISGALPAQFSQLAPFVRGVRDRWVPQCPFYFQSCPVISKAWLGLEIGWRTADDRLTTCDVGKNVTCDSARWPAPCTRGCWKSGGARTASLGGSLLVAALFLLWMVWRLASTCVHACARNCYTSRRVTRSLI